MMKTFLTRFWRDQSAATAIEYGIVAALIAVALIAAAGTVGKNVGNTFNKSSAKIK